MHCSAHAQAHHQQQYHYSRKCTFAQKQDDSRQHFRSQAVIAIETHGCSPRSTKTLEQADSIAEDPAHDQQQGSFRRGPSPRSGCTPRRAGAIAPDARACSSLDRDGFEVCNRLGGRCVFAVLAVDGASSWAARSWTGRGPCISAIAAALDDFRIAAAAGGSGKSGRRSTRALVRSNRAFSAPSSSHKEVRRSPKTDRLPSNLCRSRP